MKAEWFYAKDKQKVGPVTEEQLKELVRSGELTPTDMVWREGMSKWQQAGSVDGLLPIPSLAPPEPPPLPDAATPASRVWWDRLNQNKPAYLSALFAVMLLLTCVCSPVASFVASVLPEGLGAFLGFLYVLFMIGLFVALVVTGMVALSRRATYEQQRNWLWGKWEPVDPSGTSLEFTEDGAIVQNDGIAGKYLFANDTIKIDIEGRPTKVLKVLTISKHELVLTTNGKPKSYRKGQTYTESQEKKSPSLLKSLLGGGVEASGPTKNTADSGISDPTVAKQVAQKKAGSQWQAIPVERRSLSEPEHTVFAGDAPCPKCKTVIWVEWQNTTVTMKCPKCGYRFNHDEAISFLSAHKPEENYKADEAAAAVEAVEVLERSKALLARHEAASDDDDDDEAEPGPISTVCHRCLTIYRARLKVGTTTRCDDCLEDFVVYKHIGEPKKGFLEGLNPFASGKCPQCKNPAGTLGKVENSPEFLSATTVHHSSAVFYFCNECRITWLRSNAITT